MIEDKDCSTQMRIYFPTTPMSTEGISEMQARVRGQNLDILRFFMRNPARTFTPFEVLEHTKMNIPITSVRRAITTLTSQGYLIMTGEMRQGA
jgi:DNA-binding IclR family transcriptional regulator